MSQENLYIQSFFSQLALRARKESENLKVLFATAVALKVSNQFLIAICYHIACNVADGGIEDEVLKRLSTVVLIASDAEAMSKVMPHAGYLAPEDEFNGMYLNLVVELYHKMDEYLAMLDEPLDFAPKPVSLPSIEDFKERVVVKPNFDIPFFNIG